MPPAKKPQFLTVPSELLEHADAAYQHARSLGYSVKVEHYELGYPNQPTLTCTISSTTLILDVQRKIDVKKLEPWIGYCSSRGADTRFSIVIPDTATIASNDLIWCQTHGVGILIGSISGLHEQAQPRDLALNISLPPKNTLPTKLRRMLHNVYQKVGRGDWQDGFSDACQLLEAKAKAHLKRGIRRELRTPSTGIIVLDKKTGNPMTLTPKTVDRMMLGELKICFRQIKAPTQDEILIERGLSTINTDRNQHTHNRHKRAVAKSLRKSVPKHMWTIISALKICA